MPNIRTTINPTVVITVTDAEYADLLRQKLVYSLESGFPIDYPDFSPPQYAELSDRFGPRVPNKTALQGFFTALGNRQAAPCNILWLGDSITEGQGATAVGNRWLDLFAQRFRAKYPTPGAGLTSGYVPAWYGFPLTGQAWAATGLAAIDSARGLGRRAYNLGVPASGDPGKLTITRKCTGFTIYSYRSSSMRLSIVVDGGAPTLTPLGANSTIASTAITGLTPGVDHTIEVTITGTSGGSLYMMGAYFHDGDEAKGVRVWDGAKSGTFYSTFSAASSGGSDAWADMLIGGAGLGFTPDLTVMSFGTNDYTSVTPDAFSTTVLNLIATVRAKAPNTAILLLPVWERNTSGGKAPWSEYLQALREIAAGGTEIAFADLGERIPKGGGPSKFGLLVDGTHLTDKGNGIVADAMVSILSA